MTQMVVHVIIIIEVHQLMLETFLSSCKNKSRKSMRGSEY